MSISYIWFVKFSWFLTFHILFYSLFNTTIMAEHNQLGIKGEKIACEFLLLDLARKIFIFFHVSHVFSTGSMDRSKKRQFCDLFKFFNCYENNPIGGFSMRETDCAHCLTLKMLPWHCVNLFSLQYTHFFSESRKHKCYGSFENRCFWAEQILPENKTLRLDKAIALALDLD